MAAKSVDCANPAVLLSEVQERLNIYDGKKYSIKIKIKLPDEEEKTAENWHTKCICGIDANNYDDGDIYIFLISFFKNDYIKIILKII